MTDPSHLVRRRYERRSNGSNHEDIEDLNNLGSSLSSTTTLWNQSIMFASVAILGFLVWLTSIAGADIQRSIASFSIIESTPKTTFRQVQTSSGASTDDVRCSLTVVLLDPRMPYFPANDTIYTKTLESVAKCMPSTSCIVLQTIVCHLQKCRDVDPRQLLYLKEEVQSSQKARIAPEALSQPNQGDKQDMLESCAKKKPAGPSLDEDAALSIAESLIRKRSGHLLTEFWERGRVRLSIIDQRKYGHHRRIPICRLLDGRIPTWSRLGSSPHHTT
jgi:hypothetical protein